MPRAYKSSQLIFYCELVFLNSSQPVLGDELNDVFFSLRSSIGANKSVSY